MRSSNPALSTKTFSGLRATTETGLMTIQGTATKGFILLVCALITGFYTWNLVAQTGDAAAVAGWMWGGIIGGLVLALVTIFKQEWAPVTSPLYALCEGLFLGALSATFESTYPGIVIQAVSLTTATFTVMLLAYQTGWIQVTDKFRLGVVAATGGIALVYFVSIILGFFGVSVPFIFGNGFFGIGFSLFVVGIAALNLAIDFDFIDRGTRSGAPKYMEWYGAFALMVTLVWLYIEILRLLSKLRSSR